MRRAMASRCRSASPHGGWRLCPRRSRRTADADLPQSHHVIERRFACQHGIFDNTTFDPKLRNQRGWYWYAEDIRVPTLWDAAAAANLKTANIYWPVSVGAKITYNLPQIWRAGTDDDLKLQRALSTPGLEQELAAELGQRYPGGMEETVAEDEIRARFAIRLLEKTFPNFSRCT